jgi:lipid-A-disaccharide synthase
VEHAAAAGLRGIAIEAGGTLIIDADAVIERADRLGLFIMARDPDAAPPLFWLVAGEPSGDAIGASLMQALRERLGGAVRFAGIGGERMAAEGLTSLLPIRDLAIMGMLEVLPRARRILRWIETTAREIERLHPAAVVTIDSSGFCFRLGERLRRNPGPPPIIHYVAPMVWVWRGHRARSAARAADHLLTLLPFEPPYFEAVGLPATYVGHPVIESGADRGQAVAFRERHGLAEDALVISVLPGSRRTEVARLLPVFEATMRQIHLAYPSLVVLVPTVETVADQVEAALRAWPMRTILVRGRTEKYDGFAASKAALAASGTVSLELAMAKVPMVIAYKGWPPTIWLLRRLTKVPYATLVNILLKREAIPELLQDDCRPDLLVPALRQLIEDAPAAAAQRNAFAQALSLIGSLGDRPSLKAADCILALVEARRPPPDQALSPSGR